MNTGGRIIRGSVAIFYALIGLEIIIMISPFAAYFYAGYGPLLNILTDNPATAWLTGFFLPHAVVSKSELLNFLNSFGRTLFSLGILAFLFGAVQIYTAKLRRKSVVTGVLYKWIRHPQYLFLAIAGFGLLLFWPRFFILVLYISMLFIYYLLARHEEQRMLARHGDRYRAYMERTAMFLPGEPGGKLFRALFAWNRSKWLALGLAFFVAVVLSTSAAFALRSYTISQTSMLALPEKQLLAISIHPRAEKEIREILDIALQDSAVTATLEKFRQRGHKGFIVHLMPQHYMMQGLFAQPDMSGMPMRTRWSFSGVLSFIFPFLSSHSHRTMMGAMAGGPTRLIFSQLTWPNGEYAPAEKARAFTVKHLPVLRVDVNPEAGKVMHVETTEPRNLWGNMPMPIF